MEQSRLREFYKNDVINKLQKLFEFKNVHQVPALEKIVLNIGVASNKESKEDIKSLDTVSNEISSITGQKPLVCRAKHSISNFKIREGMRIGIKVTLRNIMMYEFLDRLVNIAIPRIRDFRGVEPNAFDGKGNFNLGLSEQYIFPEIDIEQSDKPRGMNITIVTTAKKDEHGRALLEALGMPFKKRN
jgi:large subunit ribosomal protein L5